MHVFSSLSCYASLMNFWNRIAVFIPFLILLLILSFLFESYAKLVSEQEHGYSLCFSLIWMKEIIVFHQKQQEVHHQVRSRPIPCIGWGEIPLYGVLNLRFFKYPVRVGASKLDQQARNLTLRKNGVHF